MNPLHGSISEGRLFRELDSARVGIKVYKGQDWFYRLIDRVFGKAEAVSVAGNVIAVDKQSAEDFFARNARLLEGCDEKKMTLKQKLLVLLRSNKKLPRGLVEEEGIGGEEAKKKMVGAQRQFMTLAKALQRNEFVVDRLLDLIKACEKGFLCVEREEVFRRIAEENKDRVSELKATSGDERVRRLARRLIESVKSLGVAPPSSTKKD